MHVAGWPTRPGEPCRVGRRGSTWALTEGPAGSSLARIPVCCRRRGVAFSSTAVHLIRPSTPSDHRPANPVTTPLIPGTSWRRTRSRRSGHRAPVGVFAEEPGAGTPGFSLSGRKYLPLGFPDGVGVAGHELDGAPAPRRPFVAIGQEAEPASTTITQQVDGFPRRGKLFDFREVSTPSPFLSALLSLSPRGPWVIGPRDHPRRCHTRRPVSRDATSRLSGTDACRRPRTTPMPVTDQVAGHARAGEAGPLGTSGVRDTPPPHRRGAQAPGSTGISAPAEGETAPGHGVEVEPVVLAPDRAQRHRRRRLPAGGARLRHPAVRVAVVLPDLRTGGS